MFFSEVFMEFLVSDTSVRISWACARRLNKKNKGFKLIAAGKVNKNAMEVKKKPRDRIGRSLT